MIPKDDLLEILGRCLQAKERAVFLYGQYAESTSPFFGFAPDEQLQVQELFLRLKSESETHLGTFRRLIETLEAAPQNDF